jgi:hypothetical protein
MAWSDEARRRSAEVRRLKAMMRKRTQLASARSKKPVSVPWKPKMSLGEAQEWAKDSIYPDTVLRVGSPKAAKAIGQIGFDMDKPGYYMHGKGAYFALSPDTIDKYGEFESRSYVVTAYKVKLKNPLFVDYNKDAHWNVGKTGSRRHILEAAGVSPEDVAGRYESDSGFTALLHELGYDGIVIKDQGWHGTPGGSQVVVFDPKNIVQIDAPDASFGDWPSVAGEFLKQTGYNFNWYIDLIRSLRKRQMEALRKRRGFVTS